MQVKLKFYTQVNSEDLDISFLKDLKDIVAYCARVSNPSNQHNTSTSDKLINYLLKHKHFSPFEMVNIVLEIETTRDISHQIIRHRSFAFQEFSQRYANPVEDLQFVVRETRMQDSKNRQNSLETTDADLSAEWHSKQAEIISLATKYYNWAIANGIAKEQARAILPEGNTVTRLYMNGSLRSWIHYIEVRSDISTQKEHRLIALACAEAINKVFSSPLAKINNHEDVKK